MSIPFAGVQGQRKIRFANRLLSRSCVRHPAEVRTWSARQTSKPSVIAVASHHHWLAMPSLTGRVEGVVDHGHVSDFRPHKLADLRNERRRQRGNEHDTQGRGMVAFASDWEVTLSSWSVCLVIPGRGRESCFRTPADGKLVITVRHLGRERRAIRGHGRTHRGPFVPWFLKIRRGQGPTAMHRAAERGLPRWHRRS